MKAKKKASVRTLTKSGLALLLSAILFVSFTYAWFTLSVKSEGNTIESGTLRFSVKGYDTEDKGAGEYAFIDSPRDLSSDSLIHEEEWKPGAYDVKYIEVENTGSLAVQFKMAIGFKGLDKDKANLGEVVKIRIYPLAGGAPPIFDKAAPPPPASTTDFQTLHKFSLDGIGDYTLVTGQTQWFCVEYLFCDWAGNTYKGQTLEMDLTVSGIQATEIKNLVFVWDEESFLDAIGANNTPGDIRSEKGSTIVFLNDIDIFDDVTITEPHNFDLNGYRLNLFFNTFAVDVEEGCAMDIANGCIVAGEFEFSHDGVLNLGNDPDYADGTLCLFDYFTGKFVDDVFPCMLDETIYHDDYMAPCLLHGGRSVRAIEGLKNPVVTGVTNSPYYAVTVTADVKYEGSSNFINGGYKVLLVVDQNAPVAKNDYVTANLTWYTGLYGMRNIEADPMPTAVLN